MKAFAGKAENKHLGMKAVNFTLQINTFLVGLGNKIYTKKGWKIF